MREKITRDNLRKIVKKLSIIDSDIASFCQIQGLPKLRTRPTGYGTLLKIICGQQISTAAARSITKRIDSIANPMTPEIFLQLSDGQVNELGLSRQKEEYARQIAAAVLRREFSFRKIAYLNDEDAIEAMIKLKGVGRWTAEIYLLFALRRPNLWPIDDLGIVKGIMGMKKLKERPSRATLIQLGEPYQPWRSVAARLMWHYSNISSKSKQN